MREFQSNNGKKFTSFLDCIRESHFNNDFINYESVSEFLVFGACYFTDTLINGVTKKFRHQKFTLDVNDGLIEDYFQKESPFMIKSYIDPVKEFLSFFESRADHLRNRRISIDLTGGIDSRLIAVILNSQNISFDAVYSLDSGSNYEAEIARKVAEVLGVRIDILRSESELTNTELHRLFELSDGLWDFTKLVSLKNTQRWRQKNGYDLVITGVGGELYKDFWWQQDFPFYKQDSVNLGRLLKMRMYPQELDENLLEGDFKKAFSNCSDSFIKKMGKYIDVTNTQSYDKIYYEVRIKEQISLLSWITSKYIDSYSPLLEQSILSIGYNLPKRKRFFNNFHRDIISRLNPEVSKIPTTEGRMSVSNNKFFKSMDAFKFGMIKTKKLSEKLMSVSSPEKHLRRTINRNIVEELKGSLIFFKEKGLINKKCRVSDIPENMIGRFLLLNKILETAEN